MTQLTHRQYSRLSVFLKGLYKFRDHETFVQHSLTSCHTLIHCDIVSYSEIDLARNRVVNRWGPDDASLRESLHPALERTVHQHPVFPYVFKTHGSRSLKVSDVSSLRNFQSLDLYQDFFKHTATNHQIGTVLDVRPSYFIAFGFNRKTRDFTDQDHTILDLLRPHFVQAAQTAKAVSKIQAQLRFFKETLAASDEGIAMVSQDGQFRFATARAIDLLKKYGIESSGKSSKLPTILRDWVRSCTSRLESTDIVPHTVRPLIVEGQRGLLKIRLMQSGDSHFLLLNEHMSDLSNDLLAPLGLSPRETEILQWVAQGKTNAEIGRILNISPRTVQKHLERIYCRLGVENRHAAIRVALTQIGI
jgi:DNA-binding CsgD family transcriptional regulator